MTTFADVLAQFAAQVDRPDLDAAAMRLGRPPAVLVRGRPGVGRSSVAAALAAAGVRVVEDAERPDVQVVVIAEALKPEDLAAARADIPTVLVLNKADLAGRVPGGPLASAEQVAAVISATAGCPVVPMIAHLATVDLDDELVAGLHTLTTAPADMTSTDAFVSSEHPLPAAVRERLLTHLDRFGIAHAVLAVAGGASAAATAGSLRELSQTGRVVDQLAPFGPEIAYRRVCAVVDRLHLLAADRRDDDLSAFLATDAVVISVMAAAVDAVEALGLRVDPGDTPDDHVRRAVRWRRYADGPLGGVQRRCAADIARGSLRLLGLGRAERRGMDLGRAERRGMGLGRAERRGRAE